MTPLKCPHCHFQPADGDVFCGGCGRQLSDSPMSAKGSPPLRQESAKTLSRSEATQRAWDEWEAARRAGKPLQLRKGTPGAFRRAHINSQMKVPSLKPDANPFTILFGCFSMGCGGIGMIIGLLIILFGLMIMFSSSH